MPYNTEVKAEARRQFVEEELAAHAISKRFGGRPTAQTVLNWSRRADAQGRTWEDYKQERVDSIYAITSPDALARWLMGQIHDLATSGESHTKTADALAKYTKSLREIVDPLYQMSMTYQVLQRLTQFIMDEYPKLAKPAIIQALRDFKNTEHRRLLGTAPPGAA